MKRAKILVLLTILFILSGCTATYRITIDKTGNIEEKVSFRESTFVLSTYTNSISDYINEEFLAITENDESTSYVTLVSYEIFKTKTIGFGLVSAKHMSCIGNGFINITDDIAGLYNYFESGNEISVHGEKYDYWACWELV